MGQPPIEFSDLRNRVTNNDGSINIHCSQCKAFICTTVVRGSAIATAICLRCQGYNLPPDEEEAQPTMYDTVVDGAAADHERAGLVHRFFKVITSIIPTKKVKPQSKVVAVKKIRKGLFDPANDKEE